MTSRPNMDRRLVRELIGRSRSVDGVGARTEAISRAFLGAPYLAHPLGGGPSQRENITLYLGGFDCVTYVEYALALAAAATPDQFADNVRRIRYAGGEVEWSRRNHYMTDWIRQNARTGFVTDRTRGPDVVVRSRTLDSVPGIAARSVRVRSVPKRALLRRSSAIANGDLLFFVSTRTRLDVFHCGIAVVAAGVPVRLRHASRSRGQVVEQTLESFLTASRMSGVIQVRPGGN